ncbi:uncharacterized protein LOC130646225 isoform X1 [Hydractinia symbiolongicarpus]|uniref:uncharacterized protein LOC130646225 isoform X1 n=1 Tax=Hydractinia symbiolongicarpus TaxID=13093 RepID=UPI00254B9D5B|nr:uncharacterized protein LOC130646225 isoform X1 [Hydractinia symbiolongicarpus]
MKRSGLPSKKMLLFAFVELIIFIDKGLSFDSSLYEYSINSWSGSTWDEAEKKCTEKGMHLATVSNQAELNHIHSLIRDWYKENAHWIGLNDKQKEGDWRWEDGSSSNFTKWRSGEPNGQTRENCVAIVNKEFLDMPCSASYVHSVCKKTLPCGLCKENGGGCNANKTCECPSSKSGRYCEKDKNECAYNNGGCEHHCLNNKGSYSCSCKPGYKLDANARSCTDVDECAGSHGCESHCVNTIGSYQCSCNENEILWEDGKTCHTSFDSSWYEYSINSRSGSTWDEAEKKCTEKGMHLATVSNQAELNHIHSLIRDWYKENAHWIGLNDKQREGDWRWEDGSSSNFTKWRSGEPNGQTRENCVAIVNKEFLDMPCSASYVHSVCKKTIAPCGLCVKNGGSCAGRRCICPAGMTGKSCEKDKNECTNENGGCEQDCFNTFGSYSCGCRVGYKLDVDAKSCNDVDECAGSNGCKSRCVNTAGSYFCACEEGETLGRDGRTCHDANQICEMEDRGCEFKCNNDGKGSYFCSCDKGFGLTSDHKTCKEVYDPDRFVYSSITIHWVKGWSNARKQCFSRGGDLISITSSEEQEYLNNVVLNKLLTDYAVWIGLNDRHRNGDWVWSDGSVVNYTNWVSSRKDADSGKHCGVQVNEAWRPMLCGSDKVYSYVCKRKNHCYKHCKNNAKCQQSNTEAVCICTNGYTGPTCNEDLNECELIEGLCQYRCVNTKGSYKCVCPNSAVLGQDGRACKDKNDVCGVTIHGCGQLCENDGKGGFTCSCRNGYLLDFDNKTCTDINECEVNNGGCGEAQCVNSPGHHFCQCKVDYDYINGHPTCAEYSPNNQRYYVSSKVATFQKARSLCTSLGGYITTISGEGELQHITKRLDKSKIYWIGLKYLNEKRMWEHGSFNFSLVNFTGISGEKCVGLIREPEFPIARWKIENCATKFNFVCKLPREQPVVPQHYKYQKIGNKFNWFDANKACISAGGSLVTIRNMIEQTHIESLIDDNDNYWIGLSNTTPKKSLAWIDGHLSIRYKNYLHQDLDFSKTQCAAISKLNQWKWEFTSCDEEKKPLCRIPYFQFSSSKYFLSDIPMDQLHSRYYCSSLGGSLTSVTNSVEQIFLNTKLTVGRSYWNGLQKTDGHQSWQWSDNSQFNYQYWLGDSHNDRCVIMTTESQGKWQDTSCDDFHYAICKVKYHMIDGYKYIIPNNFVDWKTAERRCAYLQGHLASIPTSDVQKRLEQIISNDRYWLGYHRNSRVWTWSDQSFSQYRHSTPGTGDCMSMSTSTSGWWKPTDCTEKMNYICKVKDYPFNNFHYKVVDTPRTWDNARQSCWEENGELVSIASQYEEKLIRDMTDKNQYWIGLNDHVQTDKFVWTDGEPVTYWNLPATKRGLGEHCVQITKNVDSLQNVKSDWTTAPCHFLKKYVCKIPRYQTRRFFYQLSDRAVSKERAVDLCDVYNGKLLSMRKSYDKDCLNIGRDEDKGEWVERACQSNMQFACRRSKFSADNSSYVIPDMKLSWPEARTYCLRFGGTLSDVLYKEEAVHVANQIKPDTSYWIGLHDIITENHYTWTSGAHFVYSRLGKDDNNARTKNCFYVIKPSKHESVWYSSKCTEKKKFICKTPVSFAQQNYHYIISTSSKSAELARKDCIRRGADLTSVFNKLENKHIASLLSPDKEYWIGLTDLTEEGRYAWYDGTLTKYRNWAANEPVGRSSSNCVTIQGSGQWKNIPCNYQRRYICRAPSFISDFRLEGGEFKARRYHAWVNGGTWSGTNDLNTYQGGKTACESNGGFLASVRDQDELDWFKSHIWVMNSYNFYLGKNPTSRSTWDDGFLMQYFKWSSGQPDQSNGRLCLTISRKYDMKYTTCSVHQGYLCKKANLCFLKPCKNLGTCTYKNGGREFQCTCKPGFSGTFCEYGSTALNNFKAKFQELFKHVVDKNTDSISQHVDILRDAGTDDECESQSYSELFCKIKQAKDIISNHLSLLINAAKNDWSTEKAMQRRSTLIVWFVAHQVNVGNANLQDITKDVLGLVYKYVTQNDIINLGKLANLLPGTQIELIKAPISITTASPFDGDINAVFKNAFASVTDFLAVLQRGDSKNKVIISQYNLKEKLKLAKLDAINGQVKVSALQIKRELSKFKNDLKDFIYNNNAARFAAVGRYFNELADFDREKNSADIGFIRNRLNNFKSDMRTTSSEINRRLVAMVKGALAATGLELIEKTALLIAEMIAAANPFKLDKVNDNVDAANKVAQAVTNVIRADKVRRALSNVAKRASWINSRYATNNLNIVKVERLVAHLDKHFEIASVTTETEKTLTVSVENFLKLYEGYSPAIRRDEIESFGVDLETLVEECCDVMFAGEGILSAIPEIVFATRADCLKTQAYVSRLISLNTELYDYQFDLLESLSQAVRSYIASLHSKKLSQKFEKAKARKPFSAIEDASFKEMAVGLVLTSRLYFLQIIFQFCDYREYLNAGIRPEECSRVVENLSDNEINTLISLEPKTCERQRKVSAIIPTSATPLYSFSHIPLDDLYEGKKIKFQIPNVDWLIRYGWVFPHDAEKKAYYLREFKLMLPDITSQRRDIKITTQWSEPVQLFPKNDGTSYLIPPGSLRFEYQENTNCDFNEQFYNPYDLCGDPSLQLCQISHPNKLIVYPSVFSPFIISAGIFGKHIKKPKFASKFNLKVDITLCEISRDIGDATSGMQRMFVAPPQCCVKTRCNETIPNRYWNEDLVHPACSSCPEGYHASKTGFVCFV